MPRGDETHGNHINYAFALIVSPGLWSRACFIPSMVAMAIKHRYMREKSVDLISDGEFPD